MATPSSRRKVPTRCFFYDKGWCKSGDQCRFTHGNSDNRPMHDREGSTVGSTAAMTPAASTVEECKFFAKGKCTKGQKCPFMHSRHPATPGAGERNHHKARTNTHESTDRPTKRSKSPRVASASAGSSASSPLFTSGGLLNALSSNNAKTTASSGHSGSGGWMNGMLDVRHAEAGAGLSPPTSRPTVSWRDALTGGSSAGASSSSSSSSSATNHKTSEDMEGTTQAAAAAHALLAEVKAESVKASRAANRAAKSLEMVKAAVQSALTSPRAAAAADARSGSKRTTRPCSYFARGCCRYGENCRYSHDTAHSSCGAGAGTEESKSNKDEDENRMEKDRGFFVGDGDEEWMEWDKEAQLAAKEASLDEEERIQSRRAECGICLEKVPGKDQFGVLVGCKHVFCFSCISEWRDKSLDKECPQCRVPSEYVIPCAKLVTDAARKDRLLSEYKESLSKIPCQHFRFGDPSCPFGSSCLYAHLGADGTPVNARAAAPPPPAPHREYSEGSLAEFYVEHGLNVHLYSMDY